MTDLPPAAITAAASAIERELMGGTSYGFAMASDEALARAALEAAAPILAEVERERLRQQIVRVNQRMLAAVGGYYRLVYPDPAPAATEVPRVD